MSASYDLLKITLDNLTECAERLAAQYAEGESGEPFAYSIEALGQLIERAKMDVEYIDYCRGAAAMGIRNLHSREQYEEHARKYKPE